MSYSRARNREVTVCGGCGKPFEVGDRIDVVREATVDGGFNRLRNAWDLRYRLLATKPLAHFHKRCTPG